MNIFIALGSNLGNSEQNLNDAVDKINEVYPVITKSSLLRTKAQYISDQPDFLNQVILIKGHGTPQNLLSFLNDIEKSMGRERYIKYGPRLIDLDIIFFGNLVLDSDDLQIPHLLYAERDFVLIPLVEIAPDFVCPRSGQSIQEIAEKFLKHQLVAK